jgi:hypothetical protein
VSPLDRWLPEFRHNEIHETTIVAPLEVVRRAVREVTGGEIPLGRLLFGIRALPALLLRKPFPRREHQRPLLDTAATNGFLLLADDPDATVFGVVGRFWQPTGSVVRLSDPGEFLAFATEGYAKGAVDFVLRDLGDGRVHLRTETRVLPLGRRAARQFGIYWFFVHPGSALLRRSWLRAIRKRALRTPSLRMQG